MRWDNPAALFDGIRVFYRWPAQTAGQEYHTGADKSKDPERFFLLHGAMRFHVFDGRREDTIRVNDPTLIEIEPWIWHETKALTEVCYVKLASVGGGQVKDTFTVTREEFRAALRARKRQ